MKNETIANVFARKREPKEKENQAEREVKCMDVWESERARAREEDDQLFWYGVSKKPYILFPKSFIFCLRACAEERKTNSVLKCHDSFICAMTHSFVP